MTQKNVWFGEMPWMDNAKSGFLISFEWIWKLNWYPDDGLRHDS